VALVANPAPAGARTIDWSGRTWDVRASGFGAPGPSQWSDSAASVAVDGGDLVLSIAQDASGRWTCPEISLPSHLGYGTYRWIVKSDLREIDANEVLGLFTYGGPAPSNNEIDIEAARWGNLAWPSGSATVWRDASAWLRDTRPFAYAGPPPYLNQFTWSADSIHYLVLDSTGARVFEWTTTTDVPVPSTERAFINYWRFDGVAPAGPKSMRLASFTWLPPGDPGAIPPQSGATASDGTGGAAQQQAAPAVGGEIAPPTPTPTSDAAAPRLALSVRPSRFALRGRRAGARIFWDASGPAHVRVEVEQQLGHGRVKRLGHLTASVRSGRGAMRFPARVGHRRLHAGIYRLRLSSPDGKVRFKRRYLHVRIVA
jgi:hypothetical protein